MRNLVWLFKTILIYSILCVACFLMLKTVVNYAAFQTDTQFLAFKQDYLNNKFWLAAFYIHVFSAVLALFAGFTQFSGEFLTHNRKLHKLMGRFYVIDILLINVPAALIMAIYANGGYLGKAAFLLQDFLWFWFTYQAYNKARQKDFTAHKNFMIRSYALTFSAITLRSWKIILSQTGLVEPQNIYVTEAWLGFLPNVLVAEIIVRYLAGKWNGARSQQSVNNN